METQVGINGMVRRALGLSVGDGIEAEARLGRYGELFAQMIGSPRHTLADEGSYFVAANPTPGTAIAHVVSAAVSETAGNVLYLKNNDALGGKRIYLDYLRLIAETAPASGTATYAFLKADSANRYTSGGSAITPKNANMDSGEASKALLYFGALTTVAPSASARLLARLNLRGAIPVVGDEWFLKFGGQDASGSVIISGTDVQRMVVPCPPIIIGPGQNIALQIWHPSNASTAAEYEFEMGWWER